MKSSYLIGALAASVVPALMGSHENATGETFVWHASGGGPSGFSSVSEVDGTNLDGTASHTLTATGSGSLAGTWHSYSFLSGFYPSAADPQRPCGSCFGAVGTVHTTETKTTPFGSVTDSAVVNYNTTDHWNFDINETIDNGY